MLAIIGGTGVYQMPGLQILDSTAVDTPFGTPSSEVMHGRLGRHHILFLARHGVRHQYLPHEVNYRANLYALKSLGATQVIGISAVGSLREDIAPGHLLVPDQYVDWTRGQRHASFFGGGVAAHVSTATPVSANLARWIETHASALGLRIRLGAVYGCVEGPRLGTRAESHFLRASGCDLVGMTNVPEVFLAREAQLCYATIAVATDYDCWMDDPAKHVSAAAIFPLYKESLERVRRLLAAMLEGELPPEDPESRTALAQAVLTPDDALSATQAQWLAVLRR